MGGDLSRLLWRSAAPLLELVDRLYHRRHHLEPIGELLWVGRSLWSGPRRVLADGTEVAPGDPIVTTHFNNQLIAAESGAAASAAASGMRFARRFFPAYRALARKLRDEPGWQDAVAVYAVGWFPPHGERFGFEFEPLPDGPRTRWLRWYIGLVITVSNPEAGRRERRRLRPMSIWLSRRRLLESFGGRGKRAR